MNKKGFNFKKVIIESDETNDLASAFISIDKYKQNKAASTIYISPKENYASTEFDTSSPVIAKEVIIEKESFNSDNFIITIHFWTLSKLPGSLLIFPLLSEISIESKNVSISISSLL